MITQGVRSDFFVRILVEEEKEVSHFAGTLFILKGWKWNTRCKFAGFFQVFFLFSFEKCDNESNFDSLLWVLEFRNEVDSLQLATNLIIKFQFKLMPLIY